VSRAKTAKANDIPFGLWAWIGQSNHVLCITWGPDLPWKRAILGESGAHCSVGTVCRELCKNG